MLIKLPARLTSAITVPNSIIIIPIMNFKAYYDEMSEGRPRYNALGHCAGKHSLHNYQCMNNTIYDIRVLSYENQQLNQL